MALIKIDSVAMSETTAKELVMAITKAKSQNKTGRIIVESDWCDIRFYIDLDTNNNQESLGYKLKEVKSDTSN